jgi:hypothetical protein
MKATFWLGVLLGFGGLLAAAHYWPWFAQERVPAQTSVVANGGRAETFVIRLPADRVSAFGSAEAGLRASAAADPPAAMSFASAPVLVEHFKLRDTAGNVIGIAARHWTPTPAGAGVAWSLFIPGRGALYLAGPGETGAAVDAALRAAGYVAGNAWTGTVDVAPSSGDTGVVLAGSAEFNGMAGRYSEAWKLTGVELSGELRGTIRIDTVTRAGT